MPRVKTPVRTIHPLAVIASLEKQNEAAAMFVAAVGMAADLLQNDMFNKNPAEYGSQLTKAAAEFSAAFWPEEE